MKENKYFILGFFLFLAKKFKFSFSSIEKEVLLGHPELWYLIRKEERIEAENSQATLIVSGEEKEIKEKKYSLTR